MKGKRLPLIFLTLAGLWFIPILGQAAIDERLSEHRASYMMVALLSARIDYMMHNPDSGLYVDLVYDKYGMLKETSNFPTFIDTKGKIFVEFRDIEGTLSNMIETELITKFTLELCSVYSFIKNIATDMNNDIVAVLYSKEGALLIYFSEGKYHLIR